MSLYLGKIFALFFICVMYSLEEYLQTLCRKYEELKMLLQIEWVMFVDGKSYIFTEYILLRQATEIFET
jgi:hypothetical protein